MNLLSLKNDSVTGKASKMKQKDKHNGGLKRIKMTKIHANVYRKRAHGGEKRQPIPSGLAGTAPLPAALFVVQTSFLLSVVLRDKKSRGQAVGLSEKVCALGRRPSAKREGGDAAQPHRRSETAAC